MTAVEVIPSAKRLIRSLRDMGYDFPQAVADIVDNSIEAGATRIEIDIEFDGDNSWVRIADNGTGMRPEELREAMRYGAEREYESDDLGKFGLGLKTASLSQCQHLSVASRWNPDRADVAAYAWDLNHIEKVNRWEIIPVDRNGLGPALRHPLKDTTGTVVLWQKLDRILGYKLPYGEAARRRLSQMCREVELHLGMVFHRFMSGLIRKKRISILLNGNPITPWDPFCQAEPKTKALQILPLPIKHEGISGEVLIHPYILPHQHEFTSPDAFRLASGPANWNQQQGFYIYRAGRLIQSGGWSNLRAPDEHTKLARIALYFSPAFDEAFKINVAKMRVQLPSQIREDLREAIAPFLKLAREIYDRKQPTALPGKSIPQQNGSALPATPTPLTPETTREQPRNELPLVRMTAHEWAARMLSLATKEERPFVAAVLSRLSPT